MSKAKNVPNKKGPTVEENKDVKNIEVKDEVVVEAASKDELPLDMQYGKDGVPEDEVKFDENKELLEEAEKDLKEKEAKEIKETNEAKEAAKVAEEAAKLAEKEAEEAEKAKEDKEKAEKVANEAKEAATAIEIVAETLSTENKTAIDHLISRFKDKSQGRGKIIQPSRGGKYVNTATKEQWIPVSLVYSIVAEILKMNE